ncbi:MAG: phosphoribosyltransferase family protein [Candidatus Saccharimonadales bacterium]
MSEINNDGPLISRGSVIGSSDNLRRLGEANIFLFDLDDTIAIYDGIFIRRSLYKSIKDHSYSLSEKDARQKAVVLHDTMYDGSLQKEELLGVVDTSSIPSFWQGFTDYLHRDISPEDVHFDPRLVKFINFAVRNYFNVGVISNTTEAAGNRVLSIMNDKTGVDLRNDAVFLGASSNRKPKKEALRAYEDVTGHNVDPSRSVYTGNAVADLLFAKNTDMTPVLIDYSNTSAAIRKSPLGAALLQDSVVINDFASVKNHVELLRPNYRRQISFSVDRSLSEGEHDANRRSITLDPTDDTVYRVAHEATAEVMSHVPEIWQSFHERFMEGSGFSFTRLPSYQHMVNEANGSYLLPDMDSISDLAVRDYYTENRTRHEGVHSTNRGAAYYRHYIDQIKHDPAAQLEMIQREVVQALAVLDNPVIANDHDHLAVLGVEDNLRGNVLSAYLSLINIIRDDAEKIKDVRATDLTKALKSLYTDTVELQYCHMLGLVYDRRELLDKIKGKLPTIENYIVVCKSHNIQPKLKNPESDNPLLVAVRANYLCDQYPNTDKLVGLTSGGVELAEVANLLYKKRFGKDVETLHYPISVHNGLTMWSKDKEISTSQSEIDVFVNLDAVEDQHVVICEDNSNSGQTLERTVERVKSYGAKSVHFAVVEIDPTRVILHHVQQKAGAKHNIGHAAKRIRPIANYFHPDFVGAVGVVKILPQDNSFSKIIAMDTANRFVAE